MYQNTYILIHMSWTQIPAMSLFYGVNGLTNILSAGDGKKEEAFYHGVSKASTNVIRQ